MSRINRKAEILLATLLLAVAPRITWADDPVLVRNKDISVTKADFDAYMERVPAALQNQARADGERNEKVLDLLFTNRAIARQARSEGFDKEPVMARRIEQQVEAFLAQQYLARMERNAPIPPNLEARARELYLANTDRYTEPPRMGLQHILVDLYGRTRQMALDRAREIRAKALAGEDFLALAATYSNDPGLKANNGILGSAAERELEPVVGEAAFRLKADGEISDVVESRYGFHLLKRTGLKPGYLRKYEDVKDAILEEEKSKMRSDISMKFVDAIRRSPDTRWNASEVASLRTVLLQEQIDRLEREAAREKRNQGTAAAPKD